LRNPKDGTLDHRGKKKKVTSNFNSETMQARILWSEIFKVLREEKQQYKQSRFSTL
jgi:hypothetical protein